jgi:hypothetical protein
METIKLTLRLEIPFKFTMINRETHRTGIDGLYDQLLSEQIMYSSPPNVRLYPLEIHDNDFETNKLRETKHVRITSKCVQMIT